MFFPLGLSNFWVGAWFPFDEGKFNYRAYPVPQKRMRCYITVRDSLHTKYLNAILQAYIRKGKIARALGMLFYHARNTNAI